MTDRPPVPEVPVAPPRRRAWDRVSLVWLVPIVALLAAGAFAWQRWDRAGPVIAIAFDNAEGVVARETELRYRDVTVGVVEGLAFTEDLAQVLLTVRLDPAVAPYVDESAQFYIVRPEITPSGVTGIGTVLTGVYVEGVWDAAPGTPQARFEGLDAAPLLQAGQQGLRIGLRSSDGTLTSAMPILYKGVTVGQVGPPRVSADGLSVEAEGVVYAPYDQLLTEATRFWDASGFSLSLSGAGADVNFDNLTALIVGGIAFETVVSGARPAEPDQVFDVFIDEATARDSVFIDPRGPVLRLVALFEGDAGGLARGAPVEIGGLRVGEIEALNGLVDPERFGDPELRLQAVLAVQPARLGLEGEASAQAAFDWLDARVREDGLRVRLATGNIITGGLEVQLVEVPGAPPAAIDPGTLPFPSIPTTTNEIADVTASVQGTLDRIDALPVEQLLDSAVGFLDNASTLVGSPDAQAVPGEVRALVGDVRAIAGAPEVQAIPGQLSDALGGVNRTVAEAEALLAQANEAGLGPRLAATLDAAEAALAGVQETVAGVPPLVARLDALAADVEALPLDALVAQFAGVGADARALLTRPEVQALPGQLGALSAEAAATLGQARGVLAEVDAAAIAPRIGSALAAVEDAARGVEASVAGVPALVARIDALAATANDLPLEELVTQAAGVAGAAGALLSAEGTRALPADLSAALAELSAVLREAREGGVVTNANAALASIASAANSLPALVTQAGGVLDQASAAVAGFDSGGIVREAQGAIAEVGAAAQAVADLARAIERDPNSLIFGD